MFMSFRDWDFTLQDALWFLKELKETLFKPKYSEWRKNWQWVNAGIIFGWNESIWIKLPVMFLVSIAGNYLKRYVENDIDSRIKDTERKIEESEEY